MFFSEDECCYICGKSSCEWFEFGFPAVQELESKFTTATAKELLPTFNATVGSLQHLPHFLA
jgi:hypothetical protein